MGSMGRVMRTWEGMLGDDMGGLVCVWGVRRLSRRLRDSDFFVLVTSDGRCFLLLGLVVFPWAVTSNMTLERRSLSNLWSRLYPR